MLLRKIATLKYENGVRGWSLKEGEKYGCPRNRPHPPQSTAQRFPSRQFEIFYLNFGNVIGAR
jgi:hypothetical protein